MLRYAVQHTVLSTVLQAAEGYAATTTLVDTAKCGDRGSDCHVFY